MKAVFRGARGVLLMLSLLIVTGAVGNAADTVSINEEALRRSVGQMIVVGFYGINNTDPGFHHVMEDLERGLIGGVLFLARNVQSKLDLETMVREVRQCNCSFTPLIISAEVALDLADVAAAALERKRRIASDNEKREPMIGFVGLVFRSTTGAKFILKPMSDNF